MSEVKWIKLTTTMFEDEKIDFIQSLPEGDSLLIIWVRLLTMAGKCNLNGFIFLTEHIPYSEDMLALKFKKSINIVKLALNTFVKLGMIEIDDSGYISLVNWEKHQNIEGLEKIREQTRNRVRKYRQNKMELSNVTSNDTVTASNATDIDIDIDKELEVDTEEDLNIFRKVVDYLNDKSNKNYKTNSKATKRLIKARLNEGFTLEDFIQVIDTKALAWLKDPKMNTFLRPETLFGIKFEGYLNEKTQVNSINNDYGW